MTIRRLNRPFTYDSNFDQLFNDFFAAPKASTKEGKKRTFGEVPAVNISETENSFDISVAAPGMKKSDFQIEINEGVMSISSEKSSEENETKSNFTRQEFNYSSFERRFTLPENIDENEVVATYEDGILQVVLPKAKEEEVKETKKLITIS